MERRVTTSAASERAENGRGHLTTGPESSRASGRSAVTKADDGVAPDMSGGAQAVTSRGVGVAELTHATVRGQLSEYLDQTLDARDRQRANRHLAGCDDCAAYLRTLDATRHAAGQLPSHRAPAGSHGRILDRVRRDVSDARADA